MLISIDADGGRLVRRWMVAGGAVLATSSGPGRVLVSETGS